MRYFLDISYDGTAYHGWQIQNNASSVQQTLNEALSTILRQEICTTGSGRTDTGVHALNQVVHFDVQEETRVDNLCHKLNSLLPKDIAVNELRLVANEASARFSAISRAYLYRIHNQKTPFKYMRSYLYHKGLDIDAMNKSCELIKSWVDFEAFSKVKTEVNNFNCEIFEAYWEISNDELHFHVSANRFLRGMIRALVGTMLLIGEGTIDLEAFKVILASRDRKQAGRSVPAHGLYLKDILYPESIYL